MLLLLLILCNVYDLRNRALWRKSWVWVVWPSPPLGAHFSPTHYPIIGAHLTMH